MLCSVQLKPLLDHVRETSNIPERLNDRASFSNFIQYNGDEYIATFIAIANTEKQFVGYLISISDTISGKDRLVDFSLLWQEVSILLLFGGIMLAWSQKLNTLNAALVQSGRDLEEKNSELEQLSHTDQLTKIANRLYLDQEMERDLNRYQRYHNPFAVILIDIDHFKIINDNYGHLVGDGVLVELTALISRNLRKVDTFGRWGGEEFLIICPERTLMDAEQMAEKFRELVTNHSFATVGRLTANFGVTDVRSADDNTSKVIERADEALYLSKNNGRNRVSAR